MDKEKPKKYLLVNPTKDRYETYVQFKGKDNVRVVCNNTLVVKEIVNHVECELIYVPYTQDQLDLYINKKFGKKGYEIIDYKEGVMIKRGYNVY